MANKPLTRKEWLNSLKKMIDEFDWEGEKQEPVAIGWYIEGYGAVLGAVRPNLRYEEWRPFYAMRISPQRTWVGLTDDEVHECLNGLPTQTIDVYARRIEAKLKEKNNG